MMYPCHYDCSLTSPSPQELALLWQFWLLSLCLGHWGTERHGVWTAWAQEQGRVYLTVLEERFVFIFAVWHFLPWYNVICDIQVTALAYSGQHSRLLSTGEDSRLVCWNMEMPRLERNLIQILLKTNRELERNYLQILLKTNRELDSYLIYKNYWGKLRTFHTHQNMEIPRLDKMPNNWKWVINLIYSEWKLIKFCSGSRLLIGLNVTTVSFATSEYLYFQLCTTLHNNAHKCEALYFYSPPHLIRGAPTSLHNSCNLLNWTKVPRRPFHNKKWTTMLFLTDHYSISISWP